ncbi:MAG: hypothetical protein KC940_15245, partial [Candidatus Omnitrophica bacterium]|nr:hypothetical protein [Candidatus Omnitrophota bacterium]
MTGSPQGASPPVANRVETHEREDVSDSLTYNTVDSIVYQSGHGQDLMKLEEDEVPGRWVVQDARLYNLRGSEWAMYQPYYRSDSKFHLAGEGGLRSDDGAVSE